MTLDKEEFIDAAKRLYSSLSLPDKNVLIRRSERNKSNSARSLKESERPMFKPSLNPKSLRMTQQK